MDEVVYLMLRTNKPILEGLLLTLLSESDQFVVPYDVVHTMIDLTNPKFQSTLHRIWREFVDMKFVNPLSGIRVHIPTLTEDRLHMWDVEIDAPAGCPYEGGTIQVLVNFSIWPYPMKAPMVIIQTEVYHPNIGRSGEISLDVLSETWTPTLTVRDIFVALQGLLGNPNPTNALRPEIGEHMNKDYKGYCEMAKQTMMRAGKHAP
eukprot:PhF_6_TR37651/c1_g1_i2/m.56025